MKKNILIEIEGQVMEVLCATPALTALKNKYPETEITVCSPCVQLLINHPAVSIISENSEKIKNRSFDSRFLLTQRDNTPSVENMIIRYAEILGIKPTKNSKPQIYLESFDYLKMQRYNLCSLQRPSIAVMTSSLFGLQTRFNEIIAGTATQLKTKLNTSIVTFLPDHFKDFTPDKILPDKLGIREKAIALSFSDALITDAPDGMLLAASLQKPVIFITNAQKPYIPENNISNLMILEADHPSHINPQIWSYEIFNFIKNIYYNKSAAPSKQAALIKG